MIPERKREKPLSERSRIGEDGNTNLVDVPPEPHPVQDVQTTA